MKKWWNNLLCGLNIHDWSPWDTPRPKAPLPGHVAIKAEQFRKCKNCNKHQRNEF